MRPLLCCGIALLTGVNLLASKKVVSPDTSAGNEQVDIIATIVLSEDEVAQKLGADPGKGIVLLQVRVVPKTDTPVQVSPDDFILLAHDDGERSKPFDPEQIAGAGRIIVSNTAAGPTKKTEGFGGFGGIIGGGTGSSPGNSKPVALSSKVDGKSQGNGTLLQVLKAKELPETQAKDEVQGYLYFPLDGKHKLKNLAILYRGPAGKLNLEFEH